MRHLDVKLLGHDAAGQSRIHVAHHHDQVGVLRETHLLEGHHDPGRLSGVRARTGVEKMVRRGDGQIVEKGLRHLAVIVLPGMHDAAVDT